MRETEIVDLWAYEYAAFSDGYKLVCGNDEAGRGPLAGPVCAAAVILPPDCRIEGLNDSKKLTDKRRRELYDVIVENAVAYGIAFASHQEIDEINILQATFLAMRRAMAQLAAQPELALVDGNRDPQLGIPTRTIVKGDGLSASIAAASILAGPLDGGAGREVSAVRLRRSQGLRHEAALCRADGVRPVRGAPTDIFEKIL